MRVEPFAVAVSDAVLDDLRERIRRTRWPDPAPGEPWSQGVDLDYLRGLLAYWADGFDWRAQERWLNRFEHRVADVDGVRHPLRPPSRAGDGRVPLVLTHGWPSTFVELLSLVDRLGDRFDLVVPSLPGYAFSQRPSHQVSTGRSSRGLWHRLMQGLGYERYGAHGGDFGAGVATHMALSQPDRVIGIHLSTAEMSAVHGAGRAAAVGRGAGIRRPRRPLGRDRARLQRGAVHPAADARVRAERLAGRAGRLGAGQVALLVRQRRRPRRAVRPRRPADDADRLVGDRVDHLVDARLLRQPLARHADRPGRLRAAYRPPWRCSPTSSCPKGEPPRSWYERLYDIQRWTVFPRGGHFAAAEEPDLLAGDIAEFFGGLD